jgi:hypothetical protein
LESVEASLALHEQDPNLDLGELPAGLAGAAGGLDEAFPSLDPWLELARAAALGDRRATEALVRGVGPRVHDVARAILDRKSGV